MLLVGRLDGVPRRVVSLNPSVNEFLALLGVGLVGRDVFSYRPRELEGVPRVGTFVDADLEALKALRPDLVILYYNVQRGLLEDVARHSTAVLAVPTPTSVDEAVAVFRFLGRVFDRDEEADRLAGIYRDLLRGHPIYEDVVAVLYLGGYDVACSGSYVADALTRVGLRYLRGLRCVFRFTHEAPRDVLERAGFVVYESRLRRPDPAFLERETAFLGGRPHLVTPNDTLAHYGPSLPLDLARVAEAAARGARVADGVSSVVRPSLADGWYRPYL